MIYRISRHAWGRMRLRDISEAEVDAVMNAPGQIVSEDDGKSAYQSLLMSGGRSILLRAIVADDVSPAVVVTVYTTTQVAKYWVS